MTRESYIQLINSGKINDEQKKQAIETTIEMLDKQIQFLEKEG